MIIRPEKKKKKEEEKLRNSLKVGDKITTIGGIVGKVVDLKDDNIVHRDQHGPRPHGAGQVVCHDE